jgi:hypothetical protein
VGHQSGNPRPQAGAAAEINAAGSARAGQGQRRRVESASTAAAKMMVDLIDVIKAGIGVLDGRA